MKHTMASGRTLQTNTLHGQALDYNSTTCITGTHVGEGYPKTAEGMQALEDGFIISTLSMQTNQRHIKR